MSKQPAVKPKAKTKSTAASRPYSVSKDEALARSLQEDMSARDEEIARQLQQDLLQEQEDTDAEFARRLQDEQQEKNLVTMVMPPRAGRPMSATPIHNLFESLFGLRARLEELDEPNEDETNGAPAMSPTSPGATGLAPQFPPPRRQRSGNSSPERNRRNRSPERAARGRGTGIASTTRTSSGASIATGTDPLDSMPGVRANPAHTRHRPLRRLVIGSNIPQTVEPEDMETSQPHVRPLGTINMPGLGPRQGTLPSVSLEPASLPDGEFDPDLLVLDDTSAEHAREDNFINIMRDPFLLMLLLMGRDPNFLVPDDVDLSDYEALWDIAERVGEVRNRGLQDDDINRLPTRTYRRKSSDDAKDECRVCLSAYKSGDRLKLLPCKHEYHQDCIKEWLKRNATCPICRDPVKKNS